MRGCCRGHFDSIDRSTRQRPRRQTDIKSTDEPSALWPFCSTCPKNDFFTSYALKPDNRRKTAARRTACKEDGIFACSK